MKSLCVIDDDPIVIFGLKRMLEHTSVDAKFVSFENGLEAMDYLRPKIQRRSKDLPDLIFVDLNMPIMDGWDFIENYTEELGPVADKKPILYIVSSSIDQNDHERAERLSEVTGFIIKPVSVDELQKILQENNF